jgi:L-amino acid N-acyltransferase YncA
MQIRLATASDAGSVRAIYAPVVESTAISFELDVPSEDEMAARITGRQPAHPWLVAVSDDGAVLGYAYAGRFSGRAAYDWSVETSLYVAESAQGRGAGRSLYAALLAVLSAQGYRQVMAGIALPNPASIALHEKAGFTPVGVYRGAGWKLGAWHDVSWWQRALAPADAPPAALTPLTSLPPDVLAAALSARPSRPDGRPARRGSSARGRSSSR